MVGRPPRKTNGRMDLALWMDKLGFWNAMDAGTGNYLSFRALWFGIPQSDWSIRHLFWLSGCLLAAKVESMTILRKRMNNVQLCASLKLARHRDTGR